jgi:hypothetical protein
MQRRRLGELEVSAVGLGCATMTSFYDEPDEEAAIETVRRAHEIGVDFLDSSDAYGRGRNEELIARAVRGHRDEYVIASKFGNLRAADGSPTSDGRPEYVKGCCERSLTRLESDVIDLYYIHRVDPTVREWGKSEPFFGHAAMRCSTGANGLAWHAGVLSFSRPPASFTDGGRFSARARSISPRARDKLDVRRKGLAERSRHLDQCSDGPYFTATLFRLFGAYRGSAKHRSL